MERAATAEAAGGIPADVTRDAIRDLGLSPIHDDEDMQWLVWAHIEDEELKARMNPAGASLPGTAGGSPA